jgi:hypothetical protein
MLREEGAELHGFDSGGSGIEEERESVAGQGLSGSRQALPAVSERNDNISK